MSNNNINKTNTNNKENIVNKCQAITNDSRCNNKGGFHMQVFARAGVCYAKDGLPERLVGAGFALEEVDFCGTHRNVLRRGGAVSFFRPINTVNFKEDMQMNINFNEPSEGSNLPAGVDDDMVDFAAENPRCRCENVEMDGHDGDCPTLKVEYQDLHNSNEYVEHHMPKGGYIFIKKCNHEGCEIDHHSDLFDASHEECCDIEDCFHYNVWECQGENEEEVKPVKMIKCGNCHGEHESIKLIRECYGVTVAQAPGSGDMFEKGKNIKPVSNSKVIRIPNTLEGRRQVIRIKKSFPNAYVKLVDGKYIVYKNEEGEATK